MRLYKKCNCNGAYNVKVSPLNLGLSVCLITLVRYLSLSNFTLTKGSLFPLLSRAASFLPSRTIPQINKPPTVPWTYLIQQVSPSFALSNVTVSNPTSIAVAFTTTATPNFTHSATTYSGLANTLVACFSCTQKIVVVSCACKGECCTNY